MQSTDSSQNRTVLIIFIVVIVLAFFCLMGGAMAALAINNYVQALGPTQTAQAASLAITAQAEERLATRAAIQTSTAEALPRATEAAQQNAAATAQMRRTATAVAQNTGDAAQWPVALNENFADNHTGWEEGPYQGQYADGDRSFTNGAYHWSATAHESVYWTIDPPDPQNYASLYLSVDVRIINAPTDADFGITFRRDEDVNSGYYFGITPSGKFMVQREVTSDWTDLIEATSHNAVNPLGTNHLLVIADGTQMSFFINNQLVGAVEDSELKTGMVALSLSMYDTNDEATVEFDNLVVRVKP